MDSNFAFAGQNEQQEKDYFNIKTNKVRLVNLNLWLRTNFTHDGMQLVVPENFHQWNKRQLAEAKIKNASIS